MSGEFGDNPNEDEEIIYEEDIDTTDVEEVDDEDDDFDLTDNSHKDETKDKDTTYTPQSKSLDKKENRDKNKLNEDDISEVLINEYSSSDNKYIQEIILNLKKLKHYQKKFNGTHDIIDILDNVIELEKVHSSQMLSHAYFSEQYLKSFTNTSNQIDLIKSLNSNLESTIKEAQKIQLSTDGSLDDLKYRFKTVIEGIDLDELDNKIAGRLLDMTKLMPLDELNNTVSGINQLLKILSESASDLAKDSEVFTSKLNLARMEISHSFNDIKEIAKKISPANKLNYGMWFFVTLFIGLTLGVVAGFFGAKESVVYAITDVKKDSLTIMTDYMQTKEDKKEIQKQKSILRKYSQDLKDYQKIENYIIKKGGKMYYKAGVKSNIIEIKDGYLIEIE